MGGAGAQGEPVGRTEGWGENPATTFECLGEAIPVGLEGKAAG